MNDALTFPTLTIIIMVLSCLIALAAPVLSARFVRRPDNIWTILAGFAAYFVFITLFLRFIGGAVPAANDWPSSLLNLLVSAFFHLAAMLTCATVLYLRKQQWQAAECYGIGFGAAHALIGFCVPVVYQLSTGLYLNMFGLEAVLETTSQSTRYGAEEMLRKLCATDPWPILLGGLSVMGATLMYAGLISMCLFALVSRAHSKLFLLTALWQIVWLIPDFLPFELSLPIAVLTTVLRILWGGGVLLLSRHIGKD